MSSEEAPAFESARRAMQLFVCAVAGPGCRILRAAAARPFAEGRDLYFPDTPPGGKPARTWYLAAAGHLAAHLRFGGPPFARGRLKAIPIALVSLLEDARVELLSGRELPGLARLWRDQHSAAPADLPTFGSLSARMARALCDPAYEDEHPLVAKIRHFWSASNGAPPPREECRRFASILGHDIGQMRLPFDGAAHAAEPTYRDDHRLLWEPDGRVWEEIESGRAGAPPSEADEAAHADDPDKMIVRYPEWDYLIGRARSDFCTLRASRALDVPTDIIDHDAGAGDPLARLALRVDVPRRQRRTLDGDAVDLDASIEARVDRRRRGTVDGRVYLRTSRRPQELAVLLLLDLSASTMRAVAGEGCRVLDLACEGARLVAGLLSAAGQTFAIHGFWSDGRHHIEYRCIKDFDDAWNVQARARLAALAPELSTRMGTALRHAAATIAGVRRDRRLLLVFTDGEPSDIDVSDPHYLVHDAARAVEEARRRGTHVYAVSLDPAARQSARSIFGEGHYRVLTRIDGLSSVMRSLCARLSGRP